MVATTPRYRTQSDPDGVIHVTSEDDVDYNEPAGQYGFGKSAAGRRPGTSNVVDVTHIVDPPDVREMQQQAGRRDPPTDSGARMYDAMSSMASDGQLSEIVEEGPPAVVPPPTTQAVTQAATQAATQGVVPRDPSLRSNPSLTRSVVKSSSSLGGADPKSNSSSVAPSPVRSSESQQQQQQQQQQQLVEVISVESVELDERGRTVSPIVPSRLPTSDRIAAREAWSKNHDTVLAPATPAPAPGPTADERMDSSSKARADEFKNDMRADVPLATAAEELSRDAPEFVATVDVPADTETKAKLSEPNPDPTDTTVRILQNEAEVPTAEANAAEEEHGGEPTSLPASEELGGGWIISSFMNTLTCRGPDPSSESNAGPLGLVSCGPSAASKTDAFPQDDEDVNSVLGPKGFGDLDSLPSLDDSILRKGGDHFADTDTVSLSSRMSRVSMQTEYLGNAVESKIKNIEIMEQQNVQEQQHEQDIMNTEDALVSDHPEVQRLETELKEAVESFGQNHVRCAKVSSALSAQYTEHKAFKKALDLQGKVVSVFSTKLGDHHQDTLDAKIRLGACQEDAEEYDEGISSFYEVMAMRRCLKGDKDPSTSDALIMISNCLRKKGQYMQAIRELKRALKVYRESLGDSHPSVASTVDEIASLYVTLGDFDKSAAILEEVVKLKAATLGMQNKQVASSLVELATSYECSEDFERAVKALKKAYKIYTDLDGFSCEEATSTLHRIALIYQASGDIHKAAIAYLGVLRGKKHLLGDDHLEVAETYYRLGVCLRETNQLDKALKCMKEALPILVGKGKNIHDVDMIAEVMHEMALLYKAKRQLAEAAKIFKQELTVRRKIGQPDYPCIAKTLNHLGVTEYEMKMHRRALKHLLEVLTIFQERQEQGIDFAEALYNIGLVFEAVRNKERAYEAFLEAARVFKANGYANEHPHMMKAVNKVKRLASRK